MGRDGGMEDKRSKRDREKERRSKRWERDYVGIWGADRFSTKTRFSQGLKA